MAKVIGSKKNADRVKCPICEAENGCEPIGLAMGHDHTLSVEDWRRLYWFQKYVALPFYHQMLANAKIRIDQEEGEK